MRLLVLLIAVVFILGAGSTASASNPPAQREILVRVDRSLSSRRAIQVLDEHGLKPIGQPDVSGWVLARAQGPVEIASAKLLADRRITGAEPNFEVSATAQV